MYIGLSVNPNPRQKKKKKIFDFRKLFKQRPYKRRLLKVVLLQALKNVLKIILINSYE